MRWGLLGLHKASLLKCLDVREAVTDAPGYLHICRTPTLRSLVGKRSPRQLPALRQLGVSEKPRS
jgi:hypothetical protein